MIENKKVIFVSLNRHYIQHSQHFIQVGKVSLCFIGRLVGG